LCHVQNRCGSFQPVLSLKNALFPVLSFRWFD
jgi:hypothetical protein